MWSWGELTARARGGDIDAHQRLVEVEGHARLVACAGQDTRDIQRRLASETGVLVPATTLAAWIRLDWAGVAGMTPDSYVSMRGADGASIAQTLDELEERGAELSESAVKRCRSQFRRERQRSMRRSDYYPMWPEDIPTEVLDPDERRAELPLAAIADLMAVQGRAVSQRDYERARRAPSALSLVSISRFTHEPRSWPMPSLRTICNRFGSWEGARELADARRRQYTDERLQWVAEHDPSHIGTELDYALAQQFRGADLSVATEVAVRGAVAVWEPWWEFGQAPVDPAPLLERMYREELAPARLAATDSRTYDEVLGTLPRPSSLEPGDPGSDEWLEDFALDGARDFPATDDGECPF